VGRGTKGERGTTDEVAVEQGDKRDGRQDLFSREYATEGMEKNEYETK